MGAQISRKMRIDRGFGNGSHKCPTLSPEKSSGKNANSDTETDEEIDPSKSPEAIQITADTNPNSSSPARATESANTPPASPSASSLPNIAGTKKFTLNGSNALYDESSYTISSSSTLSNQNSKIKLSWVNPKLSNQSTPSIDCDLTKPVNDIDPNKGHLEALLDLIININKIYVSYTSNYHIKLLLTGDLCDNIYIVAKNKLVMSLTTADIKGIESELNDNIMIVNDLSDTYEKKKAKICEKMTEYFTDKMKTFAKIILIMNYCYLKLNSIKHGGLCFMPPDEGQNYNANLFIPISEAYDKVEVYDNELFDNSTLIKHIDKLGIRDKLLLPDKNFTEIRQQVLDGLFAKKYQDKSTTETDPTIKEKLKKIIANSDKLTMIELIHEQQCKTNGGIFLDTKEKVEFNDLYSEAAVNANWLNIYKALCCSINDKLQKLTNKFITKSFITKVQEEDPETVSTKSTKSKEPSWTDNDTMTNEQVASLDKEITDEISTIIIDIDRGFLELYLFDTMTPKKLNRIKDLREQLANLEGTDV
jgi:hypothetical protein